MQKHLSQHRSEILLVISEAPDLFCFLDYDGTLAPIAPTPSEALPLPGTAKLLRDLAHAPRTEVAVITGRAIDDVRRFIDIADLYYIGIHGLEVRRPGGETQTAPSAAAIRSRMPAIHRQLEERAPSFAWRTPTRMRESR
jgi:trehalose 6-phosphate phosphatase